MGKRFVAICFRYLQTDWLERRHPHWQGQPVVVKAPDHGRMLIVAANAMARAQGIEPGTVLADARALVPSLLAIDEEPGLVQRLLTRLAQWSIYYSPEVAVDMPDGLLMDATGCAHLWGGEEAYLKHIRERFFARGYQVQLAMADTIGAAYAFSRWGRGDTIIPPGQHIQALQQLPPESLRVDPLIYEKLKKLGLQQVRDFMNMPRTALRRRFGVSLLTRLDQAMGYAEELLQPVHLPVAYQERLPCLELIKTATGIGMAMERLLATLCQRLEREQKGARELQFTCYRSDHVIVKAQIQTSRPGCRKEHLHKLFEEKIPSLAPGPGIELFTMEATRVEPLAAGDISIWEGACTLQSQALSELVDRLTSRMGLQAVQLYAAAEEYLPERSFARECLSEHKEDAEWQLHRPRPLQLLRHPEPVEVMAPVPDYPPMLFQYRGKRHKIIRADGPERIEQQWWLQRGEHRDYYYVEDEQGCRYWLFRSGHYASGKKHQWFLHGFFV